MMLTEAKLTGIMLLAYNSLEKIGQEEALSEDMREYILQQLEMMKITVEGLLLELKKEKW